jgi:dipeptidyl aminopeptidase/acylaminoacyl peptidase
VLGTFLLLLLQSPQPAAMPAAAERMEIVRFQNQGLELSGMLYKPEGPGPFPAVLYNHGSAPGTLNDQAFQRLGPLFAERGWVFFAPYRRGQGLSSLAGPFIGDEISAARTRRILLGLVIGAPSVVLLYLLIARKRQRGLRVAWGMTLALFAVFAIHFSATRAAAGTMVRLLETDHLGDQVAAFQWLEKQSIVDRMRIATAGNSFGGVEALLGAERIDYCAAIDASGGAESWASAPQLRALMARAARNSKAPTFFFQAENDYDLTPSRTLSAEMKNAGKISELKIYPAFGKSPSDGHRFAWAGSDVWAADVFRFLETHCLNQRRTIPAHR